jgi:hypothetical protein
MALAQSWSEPFNHNQIHPTQNGGQVIPGVSNGNWTDPYSPWTILPASTAYTFFSPPASVAANATISGVNVFYHNAAITPADMAWPQPGQNGRSFNAVHMAVIPKGPYRGMVVVFNLEPVLAKLSPYAVPALTATEYQPYQAYAVVDPADSPLGGVRYRNFLVPIGDPLIPQNPLVISRHIFCGGHAWSPYGDLIFGGGTDYQIDPSQTNPPINLFGNRLTYVWNPRHPCRWPTDPTLVYYPAVSALDYVGMWVRGPDLVLPRWYPTATLTHRLQRPPENTSLTNLERMVFTGGSQTVPVAPAGDLSNVTYEAMVILAESSQVGPNRHNLAPDALATTHAYPPPAGMLQSDKDKLWDGPLGTLAGAQLYEYPRCHLLSTGELFFSGYAPRGAWLDHDAVTATSGPGKWAQVANQPGQPGIFSSNWQHVRHDGSSVLFPNLGGIYDVVVRLGGSDDFAGPTTATTEYIAAGQNSTWQSGPPMPACDLPDGGRTWQNTVLLPTGGLLVLGGWNYEHGVPVYGALLFENGVWTKLPANPIESRRTYHSTAVLLPDGRIFIGGGNDRDFDYEIFSPPYLNVPANRPVNLVWRSEAPNLDPDFGAYVLERDTEYTVSFDPLPLGQAFTKVVLMAPCSVTHHSDMHQRYVEVNCTANGEKVVFSLGPQHGETVVPRGIYMMFFVTNTSVSHATWVMFQ